MADGDSGGFKPIVSELVNDLAKPVVDEFGKASETAANSAFGIKVNPTQNKPYDNQQGNQILSPEEIQKKKQEDQQKIAILRWRMDKMAKLAEEMRQIRLKKKQEEEEKQKAEAAKKQEEQQEEIEEQEEAQALNSHVQAEKTKTETKAGKGMGG